MTQFKADRDILTTADSGWRDPRLCTMGIFHTTENSDQTPPDNVATWQLNRSNDSSYNVLFGTDGRTIRGNDDDYSPWSVGMPGNRTGIHGAAVGRAARARADWIKFPKQLEAMSRWAADLHTRYGLPLDWLTPDDIVAGRKGFTSHANYWQAVARHQGMDFRSDPGAGFPHDLVLTRAAHIARGEPNDQEEQTTMDDDEFDLIMDQLVGHPWRQWPGWDQLGNRSIVDALAAIGVALKIDGFKLNEE